MIGVQRIGFVTFGARVQNIIEYQTSFSIMIQLNQNRKNQ
jgi:hypothetical protein